MATTRLPNDFREFFEFLNSEGVEYLLVGGYAVGHYGYVRATGDMDVWIAVDPANAEALARALRRFGFAGKTVSAELFLTRDRVVRMGVPPLCIDIVTSVAGLDFGRCYADRNVTTWDGAAVSLISIDDLKANKRALGRPKDLDDLAHLS
jgi:hypothetical protein